MAFPEYDKCDWIRDSIIVSFEERDPTIEELAAESLKAGSPISGLPDATGAMQNPRLWMASNSTTWWKDYRNRYVFRRAVVEIAVHLTCDAASVRGTMIDNYMADGGGGIGAPAMVKVGTTGEKGSANYQDDGEIPAGNYCIQSYSVTDLGNGGATVSATWKQIRDWYLVAVQPSST
jgi:hypothetical protein